MTKNSFAAINDQPFPLPHHFGISHLSSLASGAQTILWMAQKFSGKKGRSSAVQNMAARRRICWVRWTSSTWQLAGCTGRGSGSGWLWMVKARALFLWGLFWYSFQDGTNTSLPSGLRLRNSGTAVWSPAFRASVAYFLRFFFNKALLLSVCFLNDNVKISL